MSLVFFPFLISVQTLMAIDTKRRKRYPSVCVMASAGILTVYSRLLYTYMNRGMCVYIYLKGMGATQNVTTSHVRYLNC